jgi:hypothetical protein
MKNDQHFGDPSAFVAEASRLASCFWCETAHPAEHPLSVCPSCVESYRVKRFPMGPLEMSGSFPLDDRVIDEVVSQTSPGNYALGYLDGDTFLVFYVGRSDSDVRLRLHEWVGTPSRYVRYASSAKAAWNTRRRDYFPWDAPAQGRVGAGGGSSYTRFAYSYASSKEVAFEKECRNYDDFGGSVALDNAARPISSP